MKKAISTDKAPKAIGPYSQAIETDGMVFVSGQIPLDPATGKLIAGDIEAQAARVLDNVAAILDAAGSDLAGVVKTTVYLVDLADFARVNAVYGGYFAETPPARATVQVSALPLGARVEIDAIARIRK